VLNCEAQWLYCRERIALGGVCQTNLRAGAGNDPQRNLWCVDNAYCNQVTGKCTALPKLGELCGNGLMCASRLGCDTYGQGVPGKCVDLPTANMKCLYGGNGNYGGERTQCAAGFGCYLTADARCKNLTLTSTKNGSPCTFDMQCGAGYKCGFYPAGNLCNVAKKAGQACTREGECAAGLFCAGSGLCASKINSKSKCFDDDSCVDSRFCVKKTLLGVAYGDKLCISPLPALNKACTARCGKTSTGVQLVCRV
jgi:hypothetical protein